MSVRAAQAKALHKLQALDINLVQPFKQWSRTFLSGTEGISSSLPCDSSFPSQQQHSMTTGETRPPLQQHRMQQPAAAHLGCNEGSRMLSPSPSSSTSDFCQLDRPHSACVSNKSAKRKAAEALLAARYSSGSGTAAIAAALQLPAAAAAATAAVSRGISWGAAPTAGVQLQNKRQRSSLASVINQFENGSPAAAATATAGNCASPDSNNNSSPDSSSNQQKPAQLAKLQQVLHRLHGQHQQIKQLLPPLPQQQNDQQQLVVQAGGASAQRQDAAAASTAAGMLSLAAAVEQMQQHVLVPACGSECSHKFSNGWCHTQVRLPHVDWGRVLDADLTNIPSFKVAPGYERLQLPDGLQVLLVDKPVHLEHALQQLRASMQDPIIAIDLEWRPEFGRRFTPVAMMQLASSRLALLIRTCRMNYRLPAPLKDFLKDPDVSLVGFSWASSDEPKMQSTFGVGCKDFGAFQDLQLVAQGLGYCGFGLARLTRSVLGLHMPKSKKVTMSNWEAAHLKRDQVKYAALDVLVAGQVFRALRLWHSSPSLCEVCHYNLGTSSPGLAYTCSCGKEYKEIRGYLQHCERANHEPKWAECSGCGCTRQLPWPSSNSSNSSSSSLSNEEGGEGVH